MTTTLLLFLSLAQPADWCVATRERLAVLSQRAPVGSEVDALLAALPPQLAARARGDIGREGSLGAAVRSAEFAVRVGCVDVNNNVDVGDDVADDVGGILKDRRFFGLRTEDNFSEKVKDRLWQLLEQLFESEGMQVFANNTRAIYLSGLAIVASFIAARLLLRLRRPAADTALSSSRVERERHKAFAAWRSEALPLLDDPAQSRRALLLLRSALLARVGENDGGRDAVKPQRTSTEILLRLAPAVRTAAAPALALFDDAFYGGRAEPASVRRLLALVDDAAGLQRGTPP